MLPRHRIRDFLPDKRRAALTDIRERVLYLRGRMQSTHTSLSVSDTQTAARASEVQRIRSVEVGDVSGGTVTVQVQVDGRDMFLDGNRPVSGDINRVPDSRYYNFPAGSVVTTIIEATSGAPTGDAKVVIDTEPFVLVPIVPTLKLKGKNRLKVDVRRAVEAFNAGGTATVAAVVRRSSGGLGSATPEANIPGEGGASGGDLIIDPDPIKPGPIKPPKPGGGGGGGDLPPIKPPTF